MHPSGQQQQDTFHRWSKLLASSPAPPQRLPPLADHRHRRGSSSSVGPITSNDESSGVRLTPDAGYPGHPYPHGQQTLQHRQPRLTDAARDPVSAPVHRHDPQAQHHQQQRADHHPEPQHPRLPTPRHQLRRSSHLCLPSAVDLCAGGGDGTANGMRRRSAELPTATTTATAATTTADVSTSGCGQLPGSCRCSDGCMHGPTDGEPNGTDAADACLPGVGCNTSCQASGRASNGRSSGRAGSAVRRAAGPSGTCCCSSSGTARDGALVSASCPEFDGLSGLVRSGSSCGGYLDAGLAGYGGYCYCPGCSSGSATARFMCLLKQRPRQEREQAQISGGGGSSGGVRGGAGDAPGLPCPNSYQRTCETPPPSPQASSANGTASAPSKRASEAAAGCSLPRIPGAAPLTTAAAATGAAAALPGVAAAAAATGSVRSRAASPAAAVAIPALPTMAAAAAHNQQLHGGMLGLRFSV